MRYLARLPEELADFPIAAAALQLAEGLDNPRTSLAQKAIATKALQEVMRELRELAPPPDTKDQVDELSARPRSSGRRRQRGAAA